LSSTESSLFHWIYKLNIRLILKIKTQEKVKKKLQKLLFYSIKCNNSIKAFRFGIKINLTREVSKISQKTMIKKSKKFIPMKKNQREDNFEDDTQSHTHKNPYCKEEDKTEHREPSMMMRHNLMKDPHWDLLLLKKDRTLPLDRNRPPQEESYMLCLSKITITVTGHIGPLRIVVRIIC